MSFLLYNVKLQLFSFSSKVIVHSALYTVIITNLLIDILPIQIDSLGIFNTEVDTKTVELTASPQSALRHTCDKHEQESIRVLYAIPLNVLSCYFERQKAGR